MYLKLTIINDMKKIITFLVLIVISLSVIGQTRAKTGLSVGNHTKTGTNVTAIDSITIVDDSVRFYKTGNRLGVIGGSGTGGSMTYPGAGIALSTGAAWGASITNSSANWNTAYGWGNHAGLYDATGTASGLVGTHESTYNHTNYNTAYSDRLKWDGGSTGLTAATGRTSLGGTTAGQALFTLSNPSAITFLRVNADNTVSALSAANFRTATGTLAVSDTSAMLTNYINKADTSAMLSKYLLITDYSETTGISVGDTADMLDPYALKTEVSTEIGDTLTARMGAAQELSDLAPMLADTVPIVTFGLGSGLIADTALFNNNVLAGSFYNEGSDTLKITQLMGILAEGTGTETIGVQVSWHATFKSGSATNLNAAALTVNSITTGTEDTSFANSKIPPNVFVWCTISAASKDNKPSFMNVTLSGYKIPKY